jgi:hypothetical protein
MKDVIEEVEPAMLEPEDFNQLNAGEGSSGTSRVTLGWG